MVADRRQKRLTELKKRRAERKKLTELFKGGDLTKTADLQVEIYRLIITSTKELAKTAGTTLATGYAFQTKLTGSEDAIRTVSATVAGLFLTDGESIRNQSILIPPRDAYNRGRTFGAVVIGETLGETDLLRATETLSQINGRVYSQLRGIDDMTGAKIRDVITQGVVDGSSPKSVGQLLTEEIDGLSITRAERLARTEMANARNQGFLGEIEKGDPLGRDYRVVWQTALDSRTRATHRARHQKIFNISQARSLLGEPNCRCVLSAVSPTDKRYKEREKNLKKFI